ncbi:Phospholipid--sterol O-acyltransferase [Vitis vinifera]|uniref:Phospholipid--sterol O-acyltransferase n=1 Tax=Vitis vinifera TaxID=29760 RepID=A0A438F0Y8_VITVI|nr:Phospholipid--sterol O-acyltransferase [Vitis vinifera]
MISIFGLLSAVNCWLKCMLLDPYNQTDHPECKSRPDSGLSAITELDPGYITDLFCGIFKCHIVRFDGMACLTYVLLHALEAWLKWKRVEEDLWEVLGPLSSVWKEWIKWCIEFGIEPNAILAVPYDWRLSASKLEERDLYFHQLKSSGFMSSGGGPGHCNPCTEGLLKIRN